MAVDYAFYISGTYLGGSIPEASFPRLALRAAEKLAQLERRYSMTAINDDSENMAICSIADAMYYFETAIATAQSSSIGSVSSGQSNVDVSPKAQAQEYYRCALMYYEIDRGVETC